MSLCGPMRPVRAEPKSSRRRIFPLPADCLNGLAGNFDIPNSHLPHVASIYRSRSACPLFQRPRKSLYLLGHNRRLSPMVLPTILKNYVI